MTYNRIIFLLYAFAFLFIGCERNRKISCDHEKNFASFDFFYKKIKKLNWKLETNNCSGMYTIKDVDGSFVFYQNENSNGIYRIINNNKFLSHSFISKNVTYNIYSKPQSYRQLIINDKTILLTSKIIRGKENEIIYVFKESTDTHKVCYSFYSKSASFFMYYNPDKDEIIYPISSSDSQIKLRQSVLNDTSLFLRNRLLRQRANIEKLFFRENAPSN